MEKKLLIAAIISCLLILVLFSILSRPHSVSECLKISNNPPSGVDLKTCINDIAQIKSDPGICDYGYPSIFGWGLREYRDCVAVAKLNFTRSGPWIKLENTRGQFWYLNDKINECIVSAIPTNTTTYYYHYHNLYIYQYLGAISAVDYSLNQEPACRERILSATEEDCDVNYTSPYDGPKECQMYIVLYQGIAENRNAGICTPLELRYACYWAYAFLKDEPDKCSQSYNPAECYKDYAIIHRDMRYCGDAMRFRSFGDYADDCYLFFAIDSRDENICENISNVDRQHHCAAIVSANKGD